MTTFLKQQFHWEVGPPKSFMMPSWKWTVPTKAIPQTSLNDFLLYLPYHVTPPQ